VPVYRSSVVLIVPDLFHACIRECLLAVAIPWDCSEPIRINLPTGSRQSVDDETGRDIISRKHRCDDGIQFTHSRQGNLCQALAWTLPQPTTGNRSMEKIIRQGG